MKEGNVASHIPFLSVTTTELVPDFWTSRLTLQDFDKKRLVRVCRYQNLLNIGWFGSLVPTNNEGMNECLTREREMFYLTTHSTHFIYGYMGSDIWLRTILIVRKETHCRHIGYSYRLIARVLLYAPSHRQDNTYHDLCYTSRGALVGTRNSSMGPPHGGSIRRPIQCTYK